MHFEPESKWTPTHNIRHLSVWHLAFWILLSFLALFTIYHTIMSIQWWLNIISEWCVNCDLLLALASWNFQFTHLCLVWKIDLHLNLKKTMNLVHILHLKCNWLWTILISHILMHSINLFEKRKQQHKQIRWNASHTEIYRFARERFNFNSTWIFITYFNCITIQIGLYGLVQFCSSSAKCTWLHYSTCTCTTYCLRFVQICFGVDQKFIQKCFASDTRPRVLCFFCF